MVAYSVYRVAYLANKTERMGRLWERRREERDNNAADMLRLEQKVYIQSYSAIGSHLFILRERNMEYPGRRQARLLG